MSVTNERIAQCEEAQHIQEQLMRVQREILYRLETGMDYLKSGSARDRQKALELFKLALQDAQSLKLSEASLIDSIIQRTKRNTPFAIAWKWIRRPIG